MFNSRFFQARQWRARFWQQAEIIAAETVFITTLAVIVPKSASLAVLSPDNNVTAVVPASTTQEQGT